MARIAVLGAGGVGSAAARFLAREGHDVTVLEQFDVDHDRGSSYGTSRIIRKTYTDGFYTSLMGAAYPLWDELEREASEPLFARTGGLFFGPTEHSELVAIRRALIGGLSGHGFKFTVLLGRIAAWMAMGQKVPWELSRFSLARLSRRGSVASEEAFPCTDPSR